jgi:hypothetical protein
MSFNRIRIEWGRDTMRRIGKRCTEENWGEMQ